MASGREIHPDDLPVELREALPQEGGDDWLGALRHWAARRLASGDNALLDDALPEFERTLIDVAWRRPVAAARTPPACSAGDATR
jgi:two-component system nitrogen regulation response regulator GlnG